MEENNNSKIELQQADVSRSSFIFVKCEKEFKFKKLCPYCDGDLTYTCNGWEQDDDGTWLSDGSFDIQCSTEPDMENEDEWEEWFKIHSDMPYVNQLPVDERVKSFLNKKYRFLCDE